MPTLTLPLPVSSATTPTWATETKLPSDPWATEPSKIKTPQGYSLEDFAAHWAPERPYATDDFQQGLYRMDRAHALYRKHIEVNTSGKTNLLVFDLDKEDAVLEAYYMVGEGQIPPFQWITENPKTTHAHVGYVLKSGVATTFKAHKAPQDYLADIRNTITIRMGADAAYSGLMTRNPFEFDTRFGRKEPWTLKGLHESLGDLIRVGSDSYREDMQTAPGESRHQDLFDAVRSYSYRVWSKHYMDEEREGLGRLTHEQAVIEKALELNAQANVGNPLSRSEVTSLARSSASWTWKNFNAEGFSKVQTIRSNRRPSVNQRRERLKFIRDMRANGEAITVDMLQGLFEVSERTVYSYLEELGIDPADLRAETVDPFVAEVGRMRDDGMSYAEIAEALGKTKGQVRYAAKRAKELAPA